MSEWVACWRQPDPALLRVEYAQVGGRVIGVNEIPCRAWIDSYEQLWAALGTGASVRRFAELTDQTAARSPRLLPWLFAHPMRVLALEECWRELVATVVWINDQQRPGMHLRQVDVPGVDTKFIELHRGVLADLLDLQLGPGRADTSVPRADFAGRYLFEKKPQYVRFRLSAGTIKPAGARCGERASQGDWPGVGKAGREEPSGTSGGITPPPVLFSEFTVRASEFTAPPPGISTVFVVENEITYLALPLTAAQMVILGGGYAVSVLASLGWLASVDLVYWGDIDTHGFAILNRLRQPFPHAKSMLMDAETLLAHQGQWVIEPNPIYTALDLLDGPEAALYRDLVDDVLGPSVRLEQERVRFSAIDAALSHDAAADARIAAEL